MKRSKHIQYASRRYTMTPEESARWERSDDHERRRLIGDLGERLAENATDSGCYFLFYHSNGQLLAKTVQHEALFPQRSTP